MTEARFDYNGDIRKVEITGHANYDEKDKDIVCAGISMLSQTYMYFIQDLEPKGKAVMISLLMSDGNFFMCSRAKSPEAEAAFEMLRSGLSALADTYPDNLKVF